MEPERRRLPRKRIEKLSYVHLEPDNGAIILNASQSGLGFHAAGPIETSGSVIFFLSVEGYRHVKIEAEVAWIDSTRKMGGLRLVTSPAECRALGIWLERLIGEPIAALPSAPATELEPKPEPEPEFEAPDPDPLQAMPASVAALGSVPGEAQAEAKRSVPPGKIGNVPAPALTPPRLSAARLGFGITIYVGLACWMGMAAWVFHQEFGHSGAQPHKPASGLTQQKAPSPAIHTTLAASVAAPTANAPALGTPPSPPSAEENAVAMRRLHEEIAALEGEYTDKDEAAPPARPARALREAPPPRGTYRNIYQGSEGGPANGRLSATNLSAKPANSALMPPVRGNGAGFLANRPAGAPADTAGTFVPTPANSGLASQATSRPIGTPPESDFAGAAGGVTAAVVEDPLGDTYFDVGKFRQFDDAHQAAGKLARRGFKTTIVPKRLLWMKVFHVIVGPYKTEDEADTARAKLEPLGFKPHYTTAPSVAP